LGTAGGLYSSNKVPAATREQQGVPELSAGRERERERERELRAGVKELSAGRERERERERERAAGVPELSAGCLERALLLRHVCRTQATKAGGVDDGTRPNEPWA